MGDGIKSDENPSSSSSPNSPSTLGVADITASRSLQCKWYGDDVSAYALQPPRMLGMYQSTFYFQSAT
jgi:hypothetical protein